MVSILQPLGNPCTPQPHFRSTDEESPQTLNSFPSAVLLISTYWVAFCNLRSGVLVSPVEDLTRDLWGGLPLPYTAEE